MDKAKLDTNAMEQLKEQQKRQAEAINKEQEILNTKPSTFKGLLFKVNEYGKIKTSTDTDDNGNVKRKKISAYSASLLLPKVVKFARIGNNEEELSNSPLYYYNPENGRYEANSNKLDQLINALEGRLKISERNEVKAWLRNSLYIDRLSLSNTDEMVLVGNGVYHKKHKKLLSFSPDYVFTSGITTNYNPKAVDEPIFNGWSVSKWFDEISNGDDKVTTQLWQVLGSIVQNVNLHRVFMLLDDGQGRTGKSTFEELAVNLAGRENVANLKLIDFEDETNRARIVGRSLIIGDDNNPNGYIKDGSALKSVVTGDIFTVRERYKDAVSVRTNATIIQSMNGVPRFKDTSGGLYRRMLFIFFTHQYDDTKTNSKVKDEYIKSPVLLEWILNKAMTINLDEVAETTTNKEIIATQKSINDPLTVFVDDYVPQIQSQRVPANFMYQYYRSMLEVEGYKGPLTRRSFTDKVRPYLEKSGWIKPTTNIKLSDQWKDEDLNLLSDLDRGSGKSYRYFAEQSLNNDKKNGCKAWVKSN